MVVALKIVLFILTAALCFAIYFVAGEFNKFKKSPENEGASLMEKFTVGLIAFSCITFMIAIIVVLLLTLISSVVITLPF